MDLHHGLAISLAHRIHRHTARALALMILPLGVTLAPGVAAQSAEAGQFTFSAANYPVVESQGMVNVIVNRVGGSSGTASVRVVPSPDTAIEPADFQRSTTELEWADGESGPKVASVTVVDDEIQEPEEQFFVAIDQVTSSVPGGSTGQIPRATVTITDDDEASDEPPTGMVQFDGASAEMTEGQAALTVTVTRTGGSRGPIVVNLNTLMSTRDDDRITITLPEPSVSFQSEAQLGWNDGDTSARQIRIAVADNSSFEGDTTIPLRLGSPSPWLIGTPSRFSITVRDNDPDPNPPPMPETGRVSLAAPTLTVDEATGEAVVRVTREGGSDGPLSVGYRTVAGTATDGADFTGQTGRLVWQDGEAGAREVRIPILADTESEPASETFVLRFEDADPASALPDGSLEVAISIRDSRMGDGTGTDEVDETPVSDGPTLRAVSGDGQEAMPGEELMPLVVDVVDTAGAPLSGVSVLWEVSPAGAAELLDSSSTEADALGRTQQRVRVLARGEIVVAARLAPIDDGSSPVSNDPVGTAPGDALFTIRSGIAFAAGLSANAASTARALDSACQALQGLSASDGENGIASLTPGQQSLLNTCTELDQRAGEGGLPAALDRLAPEELFFIGDSITETSGRQLSNVLGRLNALRSRQTGQLDIGALSFSAGDQRIPGSVLQAAFDGFGNSDLLGAPDSQAQRRKVPRYGLFASGNLSFGEIDGAGVESDTDFSSQGLTLGGDMRVSYNAIIGAALGLTTHAADYTESGGQADMDATSVSLFGTWYDARAGYVDMIIELGRNAYEIIRTVSLPDADDAFVRGATDASTLALSLGAGRDFTNGDWAFGPYGRLRFITAEVDGFQEQGEGAASGSALKVDSHSVQSGSLSLGGQLARTLTYRRLVLVPQMRLEIELENEDRKEDLRATFVHDITNTTFAIQGNERDNAWLNLSLGTSLVMPKGRTGYAFYDTRLAHETITEHRIRLGVRFDLR